MRRFSPKRLCAVTLLMVLLLALVPTENLQAKDYGYTGCVQWVKDRALQKLGITLPRTNYNKYGLAGASGWWENMPSSYVRGTEPAANSIAIWEYGAPTGDGETRYGHAAYVEAVEGDMVTISEGGFPSKSFEGNNGVQLITLNRNDMNSRRVSGFIGYIYLSDGPSAAPSANQEQVQAFVTRLYQVALHRNPDPAGLADWTNQLMTGQAQAVQVIRGFLCSDEYLGQNKSNGEIVSDCYHAMLDRDADEAGYNDWVNRLNCGMSVHAIFAGFVGSQEFMALCNSYGIACGTYGISEPRDYNLGATAFVSRLYTQALGRGYDVAGLNDWTSQVLAGCGREHIVAIATVGFFHSQEFQNRNLNNEEYVKVLYRTFLGREYDEAGLADWVGQLDRGESNRDQVMYGFAYSQEFSNIMSGYGL